MKAIFLDRDGVIVNNSSHYYIWQKNQLEYVEGIFENLRILTSLGFELYIVSNQGGISRELYTKKDVQVLHDELILAFRKCGIAIQEIVFCPHHPETEKCLCRKPDSLMIEKLIAKHKINKADSYLIGDSDSDLIAAKKAGVFGIKIIPNKNMHPFISFLNK